MAKEKSATQQLNTDSEEQFNSNMNPTPPAAEEQWETKSSSVQFFEFGENGECELTGTFLGHGKTINEGTPKEVKTHLIFDRVAKCPVMVPQWDGLKPLSEIDGEKLGKQVVRIKHLGKVFEPGTTKVKYNRIKLEFSNVPATGELAFTPKQIEQFKAE